MENLQLASHDGLDRISIQVERINNVDVTDCVLLQCSFFGASYSRESAITSDSLASIVRDDYEIHLFQLVTRIAELRSILAGIEAWQESKSLFELKLADLHEQQAVFSLSVPSDSICSPEEPVVAISYSVHRIAIEVRFKVCTYSLHEFARKLRAMLVTLP